MKKLTLLPRMAFVGIRKNGATYFPYIIAGMISVFIFFVFASILNNDILEALPHSGYLQILMGIGLVLLGIILIPFLLYTNSFLIKRRKLELGLYSILGLDKKHIAVMMLFESIVIFGTVAIGGILLGIVFSKLMFLLLLNLSRLPVDTTFSFSYNAFALTIYFFSAVYALNLIVNIVQVFKSNPNDLMKGSKSGEKQPKRLWITSTLGIVLLGLGYFIAIKSKMDSNIFVNFFLAVALVSLGTHYFFTAGIIALLRILKKNKKFYYSKLNYTTISGMLYRMKKSAASLANICIFSTMTIITLLCTLSLWAGTPSILKFQHPFDAVLEFKSDSFTGRQAVEDKLQELSDKQQVEVYDKIFFKYHSVAFYKNNDNFSKPEPNNYINRFNVKFITLNDFNQMERKNEKLQDDEVIVYSTGGDYGFNKVKFGEKAYKVKRELQQAVFIPKAKGGRFGASYFFIVKDDNTTKDILQQAQGNIENGIYTVKLNVNGDENKSKEFVEQLSKWVSGQRGYSTFKNGIAAAEETISMNGGLLFLGIFFGIVFSMCLLLIMYYKQITEGFDDRFNFNVMQKVGMSDKEVRGTIKRQILLVFFLPLLFAIFHTMAGFGMVSELLGTLFLFNKLLIIKFGILVVIMFGILYGICYLMTSKVYYRIVKQMN